MAFSLGFIFGPMIGAVFSVLGKESNGSSFTMFQYPALYSLTMARIDIVVMVLLFKETLPPERRVSQSHCFFFTLDHCKNILFDLFILQAKSLGHGISGTLYLINPVSLFKYDAVSKIDRKGKCSRCGIGS